MLDLKIRKKKTFLCWKHFDDRQFTTSSHYRFKFGVSPSRNVGHSTKGRKTCYLPLTCHLLQLLNISGLSRFFAPNLNASNDSESYPDTLAISKDSSVSLNESVFADFAADMKSVNSFEAKRRSRSSVHNNINMSRASELSLKKSFKAIWKVKLQLWQVWRKHIKQTKMEGGTERHLPKTDDWHRRVRRWAS